MTWVIRVSNELRALHEIAECNDEGDAELIARALNALVPTAIFSYAVVKK